MKTLGVQMRLGFVVLAAVLLARAILPRSQALAADELPKDLVLQCEGTTRLTMIGARDLPPASDGTFNITIHLIEGSLINITNGITLGKGCILKNGEIVCELNEVGHASEEDRAKGNFTHEKRHAVVLLNRASGALRMLLTTWVFDGPKETGAPSLTANLNRTGICRAAKPIF